MPVAHRLLFSLTALLAATAQAAVDGQKLYTQGGANPAAAACVTCHGADGMGLAAAGFPRLAGLPAAYLSKQLHRPQAGRQSRAPGDEGHSRCSRRRRDPGARQYPRGNAGAQAGGAVARGHPAQPRRDPSGTWRLGAQHSRVRDLSRSGRQRRGGGLPAVAGAGRDVPEQPVARLAAWHSPQRPERSDGTYRQIPQRRGRSAASASSSPPSVRQEASHEHAVDPFPGRRRPAGRSRPRGNGALGAVPAAGGKQPPGQRLRRNGPPGPGVVRGNPEERAASGRQPAQLRQLPSRPGPPGQLRAAVGGLSGLSGVPRQEQQGQYVRRAPAGLFPVQHERQGAGGRQPGDQGPDRLRLLAGEPGADRGQPARTRLSGRGPAGEAATASSAAPRSMPRSARSATAPTARARWLWGRRCSHRCGARSPSTGARACTASTPRPPSSSTTCRWASPVPSATATPGTSPPS